MRVRTLRVDRREAGLRLDRFLVAAVPGLSRKRAKRLVDGRRVSVDGRIEAMASRVLRGGERVRVELEPASTAQEPLPEIPVLWQDGAVVAVSKPPGLPSGPTRDPGRAHAERVVSDRLGEALTLVHRLDRDTTGVLLLARTPAAAQTLAAAFRRREVEKVYLAVVRGTPPDGWEVVSHLREGEGGRMHTVRSGGMRAQTRFRTVARGNGHALVEARPRTGRTHQIRVHLARAGCPIVGDALYGGAPGAGGRPVPRHLLHDRTLVFPHPATGEAVWGDPPVPGDFWAAPRAALGRPLPDGLR